MNKYGLREDTMQAVTDSVYTLANNFTNPDNGSDEPISLKDAVNYCYIEFEHIIQEVFGFSNACRFDGKRRVLNAIESEIKMNEDIVLKM
jgi:hypothetical protein